MKLPQTIADAATRESAETDDAPSQSVAPIVDELFKNQAKQVRHFLTYRLRNADDADDAAQEVFLRMWRHEKNGQLRQGAIPYMFSAVNSIATDVQRHRLRHGHVHLKDDELEAIAQEQPTVEDTRHWRDALAHLVFHLKELPQVQRNAFVLHHFKGLNYAQIAKKLGLSTRTVERQMVRAHNELESRMRDFL